MRQIFNIAVVTLLLSLLWITGCSTSSSNRHFSDSISGVNVYFSPTAKKVKTAAILPFKAPTELIGSSVSDLFVSEFMRMNSFDLIERSQMSGVLGEAELSMNGVSDSKAMKVGQMAGADGVIIGTVTEYEMSAYKGKKYPSIGITIRMIDCDSGKIIWSADYAERSRKKGTSLAVHTRNVVHEITSSLLNGICKNKAGGSRNSNSQVFSGYPPEDIKISNLGLREVVITWKPIKTAGKYVIERSTTPNGPFAKIVATSPVRGKYIDRSSKQNILADNTLYYYRICLQSPTGTMGECSPTISSTTAPAPPPVTGVKAVAGIVRSIPLSWNPVTAPAITGYIIKRSAAPSGPFKTIKKIKGCSNTTWQDGGKEPGKLGDSETFFYKIVAVNRVGSTSTSAETVNAITRNVPPMVTEFKTKDNFPRETPLSWKLSNDEKVAGYIIERSAGDSDFRRIQIFKDSSIHSWIDKGGATTGLGRLKDGITYRYRICAFNIAKANSHWSDTVTAVTKPVPTQPSTPILSQNTPRHITLQWATNPEDDIEKYLITYRQKDSTSFKNASNVVVTMESMIDDETSSIVAGLNDGTIYEFRIAAVDTSTLQSLWSNIAQASTKPIPAPPSNLKFKKTENEEVELSWEKPEQTDIVKYNIYQKSFMKHKFIAETATASYTLPAIFLTKKYTVEITAIDSDELESKSSTSLRIQ